MALLLPLSKSTVILLNLEERGEKPFSSPFRNILEIKIILHNRKYNRSAIWWIIQWVNTTVLDFPSFSKNRFVIVYLDERHQLDIKPSRKEIQLKEDELEYAVFLHINLYFQYCMCSIPFRGKKKTNEHSCFDCAYEPLKMRKKLHECHIKSELVICCVVRD